MHRNLIQCLRLNFKALPLFHLYYCGVLPIRKIASLVIKTIHSQDLRRSNGKDSGVRKRSARILLPLPKLHLSSSRRTLTLVHACLSGMISAL